MNKATLRTASGLTAVAAVSLFGAACGSSDEASAEAKKIAFKLTDAGCEPHDAKAPAGAIEFEVENAGTSKVTEMEIMDGDEVLGEEENISEGLSESFTLTLEGGEYTIYCPGGSDERGTMTIGGG
jgi:iron uptake system component EfeO